MASPMKEYIDKELAQRTAAEITELLLDTIKSKTIVGLEGHNFEKLAHLSFISCDLESLDGLTKLPEVRVLDLSENSISSIERIPDCLPKLYHLNICGNPLNTADQLKPLSKLENLQALDVFECPITEVDDYRKLIFEAIPNLKFLNGFDINDEEAEEMSMDGEDALGEMGYEDEESADEEEEVGLDYLNSSKALKDDENDEEFVAQDKLNGNTKKRKAVNGNEVPEKKKATEEA